MNTKLRAKRKASGKTQAQVAKEANMAERMYQDYEYGNREPGVGKAIQIARAVGIKTLDEFFEVFGAATPDKETAPSG